MDGVETDRAAQRTRVRVFAALSDANRCRIVDLLCTDEAGLTCGAICAALGLSPSLTSHHLGVLADAGIIDRRRAGPTTVNRLRREELSRLLADFQRMLGAARN